MWIILPARLCSFAASPSAILSPQIYRGRFLDAFMSRSVPISSIEVCFGTRHTAHTKESPAANQGLKGVMEPDSETGLMGLTVLQAP